MGESFARKLDLYLIINNLTLDLSLRGEGAFEPVKAKKT